jgi:phospholipid transport system substrate-binding protein
VSRRIAVALVLLFAVRAATAGPAQDHVRTQVERVLVVLRDAKLAAADKEAEREERVRAIAGDFFDFDELSRRTLGIHWRRFSAADRKEFTALYRTLLERTYMNRILAYKDETVRYAGERKLARGRVEVSTEIVTAKAVVPVAYRVIPKEKAWRVYDVVIEGVSLVRNYRSQFREILRTKPPARLLEILRKKTAAPAEETRK